MKVLFITHKYPPSIGGMEKQCFELVKGMSQYAEVVTIYHDVNVESKLSFFLGLRATVRHTLSQHPDISIIHLNDALMVAFTLWLRKDTDIPVTATFHGLDILFPLAIYQNWIIPKFSYLSKMIAVSTATAEELVRRGLPKEKIIVINNGVSDYAGRSMNRTESLNHFRNNFSLDLTHKRILLMVGRPVKRKGMSWFIRHVFPNLPDDVHLLVAGSFGGQVSMLEKIKNLMPTAWQKYLNLFVGFPDDRREIEKTVCNLGVENRVSLLPRLSASSLNTMYELSDLFVMPNIKVAGDMEGFGLVALEASSRGVPVLVAGIEGIRDAIKHGQNGYLIPTQNPVEWIAVIQDLLDDSQKLDKEARRFRQYTAANYSWRRMCREYALLFGTVCTNTIPIRTYMGAIKTYG